MPYQLPHGVIRARPYEERDLSISSDSPPDSPPESDRGSPSACRPSAPAAEAKPPKLSIRRSLSWGKKRQKKKLNEKAAMREVTEAMTAYVPPFETEHAVVTIERSLATRELGLALHPITFDLIVAYAGDALEGKLDVGDVVLAIHGQELFEPKEADEYDVDNLVIARALLREEGYEDVEIAVEKRSYRTEVLTRPAALRNTSLDRIGMTLNMDGPHLQVTALDGLALKSGRIGIGDRVLSINGVRITKLTQAVALIDSMPADDNDVILELAYGFCMPEGHEFDPASGSFVPAVAKPMGLVRRSLSFGKRRGAKGKAAGDAAAATPREQASAPQDDESEWMGSLSGRHRGCPDLNTDRRLLTVEKNEEGKICVTFKAHEVTKQLIFALVGAESPAARAGIEVGDRLLAIGSQAHGMLSLEEGGEDDIAALAHVLEVNKDQPALEMVIQTSIRREVLEFGHPPGGLGGPRTYLGLSFFTFAGDKAVRITKIQGPAARSGRLALGDWIVSVNGIRVSHAETLSEHIAELCLTHDSVEFEVALGYSAGEGLWYGGAEAGKETVPVNTPRKAKRSFSFGRKPKH